MYNGILQTQMVIPVCSCMVHEPNELYVLVLWWIYIVKHLAFKHREGGFLAGSSQCFTVDKVVLGPWRYEVQKRSIL